MPSVQNKIIELDNVTVGYDSHVILRDINLLINKGDFVAVTGPNGGGKTSLLRVILRLIAPEKGRVDYFQDGETVKDLKIGYLPQKNMIDSRFPITVEEVVAAGLLRGFSLSCQRLTAQEQSNVTKTLEMIGMSEYRHEAIGNLSGGQLQRTLFGRAVISNPELLVLDEPLSYLDKTFEKRLYEIIASIADRATVLLVSHEMTQIAQMATRHLIVDHSLHDCHAMHHFIKTDCD